MKFLYANCKIENKLSERLMSFALGTMRMAESISNNIAGRHIAGQLIRSVTSAGANYEEACSAESRPDFIHKLQIVLKEPRESLYWLRLSLKASLISLEAITPLIQEGKELANIIAKSIITAKRNKQ